MARLQILELPSGAGDDRAPFVLVVDQMPADDAAFDQLRTDLSSDVAALIGARAVLAFEGSIEIPANDIAIPTDEAFKSEVQEWAAGTNRTLAHIIDAVSGKKWRPANDGQRLADERTDIARDMDRLANHKIAMLDALRMDRTRDWDDIRNAAAGLRKDRDAKAELLERLYAGEEPVVDEPAVAPTPGQFIWKWNRATPEQRLSMAAQILASMKQANDCFIADHESQIAGLRAEAARPRPETPDA